MPTAPQLWKIAVICVPELTAEIENVLSDNALSVSVLAPPRKAAAEVEALYDAEPGAAAVRTIRTKLALLAALKRAKTPELRTGKVGNLDWLKKVAADFPPVKVGRWTVYGSAHRQDVPNKRLALQVDASSAFGTGEHPTTRGCLLMLDKLLKHTRPLNMLDVGCGSGILAMSFAKACKGHVAAVELDPDSAVIARNNVSRNGLQDLVHVEKGRGYTPKRVRAHAPYDLIMANIFARPLCEMAKDLKRHVRRGGYAILSGILNHQANAVIAAHRRQGLVLVERMRLGEWTVLCFRLPAR